MVIIIYGMMNGYNIRYSVCMVIIIYGMVYKSRKNIPCEYCMKLENKILGIQNTRVVEYYTRMKVLYRW